MRKVGSSQEFKRIVGLERRESDGAFHVGSYTDMLRKPNGLQTLRPIQALALHELTNGGVFCPIGVGEGKTLVTLLAPTLIGAERPLLLLPARLVAKTETELDLYAENWNVFRPTIRSYEWMGIAKNADFIAMFNPDLIMADECQRLKNLKAAVTRRVMRFVRKEKTRCLFLSGTITTKSLHDYWHLLKVCLPEARLPMPRMWPELSEWADALDDGIQEQFRRDPGVLCDLGPADEIDRLARARKGFQKRLRDTAGVVGTTEPSVSSSLIIELEHIKPPTQIVDALAKIRETWERPDGHQFVDNLALRRYLRQVAQGFYYRWTEAPPKEWTDLRLEWVDFCRDILRRSQKYDTEFQVALACRMRKIPDAGGIYKRWWAERSKFKPKNETIWLSDYMVKRIGADLNKSDPTLVWAEHVEFQTVADALGLQYYGELGMCKGKPVESASPHMSHVLSIAANSEGRNLQAWHRSLITSCPSSGSQFEQLLGRTHRPGQKSDEVTCRIILATEEHQAAWESALSNARYLEDTTGQKQKLLYADKVWV